MTSHPPTSYPETCIAAQDGAAATRFLSLLSLGWGPFELYRAQYAYGFLGLIFWGLQSSMLECVAIRQLRGLAACHEEVLLAGTATGLFRLVRRRVDGS